MCSYLLNRRGNYHFRIRIPSDLTKIIPATELVKSLKTRDKKQATLAAIPYLQSIVRTFSLFRSGFITDEQVRESIDIALGRKRDAASRVSSTTSTSLPDVQDAPPYLLSSAISQFVSDKQQGWTVKTKMENDVPPQSEMDFQAA